MNTNITNQIARAHYNEMNKEYLKCWQSAAKKNISEFELNFIENGLKEKLISGKTIKVLEIGPGPGRITRLLLKYDIEYYGVDISEKMVAVLKQRFRDKKIKKLKVGNIANETPFPNTKFDLIIAMRVIYYNKNWKKVLEKIHDRLTPDGIFIFCMPNSYSTAMLGKIIGGDSLIGYYSTHHDIMSVMKKNKFTNTKITGYARIPDVVYDLCKSNFSAYILEKLEEFLNIFLGKTLFVRMFYITARK